MRVRLRFRRPRRRDVFVFVVLQEPVLERGACLALEGLVRVGDGQRHEGREVRRVEGETLLERRYRQGVLLVLGLRLAEQKPGLGVLGLLLHRRLKAEH